MTDTRTETDSVGPIEVARQTAYWGAQTQRISPEFPLPPARADAASALSMPRRR